MPTTVKEDSWLLVLASTGQRLTLVQNREHDLQVSFHTPALPVVSSDLGFPVAVETDGRWFSLLP